MKLGYRLPTREDSSLPEKERFDELFKAAWVLLREYPEESLIESQIIPTLAFANLLGHGAPHLAAEKERFAKLPEDGHAWNDEADGFARRYGGLRPVRFLAGTLVLEKVPVVIRIEYDDRHKNPEVAIIYVFPHQTTPAQPEEVASLYDKRMSEAAISCGEVRTGNLSYLFINDTLVIRLWPGTVATRATITEGTTVPQSGWRRDRASFPHPRHVQVLYAGLRSEFLPDLAIRTTGKPPETGNLVPGCVNFFLENYGIGSPKERHGLLMDHVVGDAWKSHVPDQEKDLFRSGENCSLTKLLRRAVDNPRVSGPLVYASQTLFYGGGE